MIVISQSTEPQGKIVSELFSLKSYQRKTWKTANDTITHWNSQGFGGNFKFKNEKWPITKCFQCCRLHFHSYRFCIATNGGEKPNGRTELSFKDMGVLPESITHDSDEAMMLSRSFKSHNVASKQASEGWTTYEADCTDHIRSRSQCPVSEL